MTDTGPLTQALITADAQIESMRADNARLRAADKSRVTVHEAEIRRLGIAMGAQADEIERLRSERLAFATESEERKAEIEQLRQRIDTLVTERDAERKIYNEAIARHLADNKRLQQVK